MTIDPQIPDQPENRFRAYSKRIKEAYCRLGMIPRRIIFLLAGLSVAALLVFCGVFFGLRYFVFPNIDQYKGRVEQIAGQAIDRNVSIARIAASWDGFQPKLELEDVVVRDLDGRSALNLPNVAAVVSWRSLIALELHLALLELSRPDLDIRRDKDGKLYIAGILIDTQKKTDGKLADWALKQDEILIRDGRVRWIDNLRGAAALNLEQVDFSLRNQWRHHQFRLAAVPPASLAGPIRIDADLAHPRFAERISDVAKWKGDISVDLEHTDLSAWKPYIDYPFDLQKGEGAVRALLDLNQSKVADFTADVKLSNVTARLGKDLPLLQLVNVSGRIAAREDVDLSKENEERPFGERGHTISLSNFSLATVDGIVLPETTFTESYVPGRDGVPGKTEIGTNQLDLSVLSKLAQFLPLSKEQRQMLADFSPAGQLADFSVQWQGSYPDLVSYSMNGRFSGLSMKGQPPRPARPRDGKKPPQAAIPGVPGFKNLTGSVKADERGGSINLDSRNLTLQLPGYFSESAMPFEQFQMNANWLLSKDQLQLQIDNLNFVQDGVVGSLSGRHIKPLMQQGQPVGIVDMAARIERFDIKKIGRYLPLQTPQGLRSWLGGALEEGVARDVSIRIKGDLQQFPFHPDKPGGKSKGEFSVYAKIENGVLNYTPGQFAKNGKSPLWPQAEKIQGYLAIDNSRIVIHADTAATAGVALSNVHAVIPDMMANNMLLDIVGNADGALQDFVRYVNVTPVAGWIGNLTENTKATGNAKLLLKMQMPLDRMPDSKVQGALQFSNNDVTLLKDLPPLLNSNGKLEFWEKGFSLNGITTHFLGGPATLAGGTQKNGKFQVRASGSVTPDGLRRAYPGAAMERLAGRISGSARFSAEINQNGANPDITVESNLRGLALDFPSPLGKSANQSLPVRFQLSGLPSVGRVERDEVRLSLGSSMSARYTRQREDKDADWRVLQGSIGVNMPSSGPAEGVALNINMHSLDLDAWEKTVESLSGGTSPSRSAAKIDASPKNLAQYVEPVFFSAVTDELFFMGGAKLDRAQINARRQPRGWRARIQSDQATGLVSWTNLESGAGIGKLTARMTSLTIPRTATSTVPGVLGKGKEAPRIPALDVTADDFTLFGKKLGRIELVANNTPAVVGREWRIDRLNLSNPDANLKAGGSWVTTRDGTHMTTLNYKLDVNNAGNLLSRLGYENVLRRGKGHMDGSINWRGLPFSLDVPTLSGKINLDMGAGQFLKVEPGAAKLLGVLSLQSLPRRLALDFRDVFSQGFAFDGITATASINNGIAQTSNLKMRGVNATVLMDGSVDIVKESQNLHIVVLPEINAGAASVVYGLAVNPAIGLGTFLAQLFLRDPLMRAFTYEYQVTGPWSDPNVAKLPRNFDNEKSSPSP